jgi:hypothetical protein
VNAYLAGILLLLSLLDGGSLGEESLFLLDFGLWSVLVEEFECLCGGIAVKGVLELSNRRWHLQAQVEDLLLALEANILWPSVKREGLVRNCSSRSSIGVKGAAYLTMRERLRGG